MEYQKGRERRGNKGDRGNNNGCNPQGLTGTWAKAEGNKGGGKRSRDVTAESGMWHAAQRQAAKAGKWWVWVKSRWTTYHAGKGGGGLALNREMIQRQRILMEER